MTVPLTPVERRWAHAALDTLFPRAGRGALPLGIEDMDVDAFLDETLRHVPLESALGLRIAFWIVGLAPRFVIGRFATLSSLEPDDRLRVLEALSGSPVYVVRSMIVMIKAIASLFYCGDRRVRPSMFIAHTPVVALRVREARDAQRVAAVLAAESPDAPPASAATPSTSNATRPATAAIGAENEQHRRTA